MYTLQFNPNGFLFYAYILIHFIRKFVILIRIHLFYLLNTYTRLVCLTLHDCYKLLSILGRYRDRSTHHLKIVSRNSKKCLQRKSTSYYFVLIYINDIFLFFFVWSKLVNKFSSSCFILKKKIILLIQLT